MDEQALKQSDSFVCPSCAGALAFNPSTQKLTCQFCGYEQQIAVQKGQPTEYNFDEKTEENLPKMKDMKYEIKCENCGSISQFDKYQTAQRCSYCGSNHVIESQDVHGIQPEFMIPFQVPKQKSEDLLREFLKKKFFAPKNLFQAALIDNIRGIYAPYWHYDADTESPYTAMRGDYYYVTRTVGSGKNRRTVTERRTRWTPVRGTYTNYFDNIEVSASGTSRPQVLNRVFPFNYSGLVRYDKEFIAGFVAERYAVSLNQGWMTAQGIIRTGVEQGIRRQIGGDTVSNLNYSLRINEKKYKHILLPFWICAYQYRGKMFSLSINGQSGKVNGDYPLSPWKVAGVTVLILITVGLLLWWLVSSGVLESI